MTCFDSGQSEVRPVKKQRKQRPCYSCEECRRLKMKCDRQAPCSNCVRRQRISYCVRAVVNGDRQYTNLSSNTQNASSQPPRTVLETSTSSSTGSSPRPTSGGSCLNQTTQTEHSIDLRSTLDASNRQTAQNTHSTQLQAKSLPTTSLADQSAPPFDEISDAGSGRSTKRDFASFHNVEQNGSYGTLMLSSGGRSKYLGPTAGSEWLKNSQTQGVLDSPPITRSPSPEALCGPLPVHLAQPPIAFPFSTAGIHITAHELLARLPPNDEAWSLAESYYRYCAWHHDVAPKVRFRATFDRVYSVVAGNNAFPPVNVQEIALVFMILSKGTKYNIEMPHNDPSATEWLHLAEMALVKGDFLSNNTIAGVQTLHLMAHMHLQSEKGHHDDKAWLLWGLVMRLIQAMGMHRDGAQWSLPRDLVEERRKVFWECNAADTFQAHCFSRPCAINPRHCDTLFPSEPPDSTGEKSYYRLRFELSQLSSKILNMAMEVRRPPYSEVIDLDQRLYEFERNVPFYIRCRSSYTAMSSRYPNIDDAIRATPEQSRRSIAISFQQANLAINISETIINLHRPYYAKALYDGSGFGDRSVYAASFSAVIERAAVIIAVVSDIHARFPAVSTRQWNFWYHVFGSALSLGTLALRHPGHPMAMFALSQIDAAISLFTSLVRNGASTPRYRRNLQWLVRLHARASSKTLGESSSDSVRDPGIPLITPGHEGREDVEALGFRTRLIKEADRNQVISPTGPGPACAVGIPDDLSSDEIQVPNRGHSVFEETPGSTDDLLRDFWDPIILQDLLELANDQPAVN